MTKREVTEFDLRAPEFQRMDVKPEDFEFREDGKVVRKDRWEIGLRNVASAIGWTRKEWEIPEVVEEVRRLLREAETRHMNLLLDLGRLINGEAPINGFSEVEQLSKLLTGASGVPVLGDQEDIGPMPRGAVRPVERSRIKTASGVPVDRGQTFSQQAPSEPTPAPLEAPPQSDSVHLTSAVG